MSLICIIFLFALIQTRQVSEKECAEIRKRAEHWRPFSASPYNDADHIIDGIYLGNVCAAHNDSWLDEHGITMVISVAAEWNELPYRGERKIQFHYFELDDSVTEKFDKSTKVFDDIADIIHNENERSTDDEPTAILVHCNMGISRSTSSLMAYGQKYLKPKLTRSQMLQFVKARRPVVKPNSLFLRVLDKYDL